MALSGRGRSVLKAALLTLSARLKASRKNDEIVTNRCERHPPIASIFFGQLFG
jgi:hypothetical protein